MILELLVIGGATYAARKYKERLARKVNLSEKKIVINSSKNEISTPVQEQQEFLATVEKKDANTDVAISGISLGLSIAGNLVYPPLSLLSIPGWFYVSIPAFEKAFHSVKQRKVDVSIPFTITNLACFGLQYYGTGNLAAFFYVLSKKLLSELETDSKKSLIEVFEQHPKTVWLVVDDVEIEIAFEKLQKGDVIVVLAGGKIPADGVVIKGSANVDQHILTGESQPVEKDVGSHVFAATVVLNGKIFIKVENAGETTTASQIAQILNQTTKFKTNSQMRADAITHKTIIPTLIAGGVSFPILGPVGATAIMNCHMGYRLSFVSSLVTLSYLKIISQSGILIKDAKCLDLLSKVDCVVFDKTGTLTLSMPYVGHIYTTNDWKSEEILSMAAAAEFRQHHPVALAILKEAQSRGLEIPVAENIQYEIGYGLKIQINNRLILVGSQRFMDKESCSMSDIFDKIGNAVQEQGNSLIMVAVNQAVIGAIELCPMLRFGVKDAIRSLKEQHQIKNLYVISGDHEEPTKRLAETVGIEHYFSNVLPQEKANLINNLQELGKVVCYIGDGINDAIALKKAQVSISLNGASTVATDTAQIILMSEDMTQLANLFGFAKKFHSTMNQSLNYVSGHSIAAIMGVLFLNFSIIDTQILKHLGVMIGVGNALKPSLIDQSSNKPKMNKNTET